MASRFLLVLATALPAMAQLESSGLRAKFGTPLNRETFHIPQGFDLVVDYGASGLACRLEVPALMPSNETVSNELVMQQRMYAFLEQVVPASMRGNEKNRFHASTGVHSVSWTEYDNVVISEPQGSTNPRDNTITLAFNRDECQKKP